MALPTYLELVNDVLLRLREPEVSTVQENVLSKLVGKLVNDAKRQVEDAYTWNALNNTLNISTLSNTYNYVLTGSGTRFKVIEVTDITNKSIIDALSTNAMSQFLLNDPQSGNPSYYNFNGVHTTGDTKVNLFPVPNAGLTISFNLYVPQEELTGDASAMYVPKEPVILGAYARALVERGEDGGLNSSEAYGLYRSSLADAIAIESSRYVEKDGWEAV
jgi:hypothetical protein